MTTTFTDNFLRPDESPISDGGVYGGDILGRADHRIGVVSHQALASDTGLGNSGSCYLLQPTTSADCQASLTPISTNSYWEILLRMNSIGSGLNGYALVGTPSTSVALFTTIGGSSSLSFDTGISWTIGDTWQIRAVGGTLFFDKNGVQVSSFADSTFLSAGLVGFLLGPDPGMVVSQFSASPIPDTSVSIPGPPPLLGRMGR